MPVPHQSAFTGRMPFLLPNQQRQSTDVCAANSKVQYRNLVILYSQRYWRYRECQQRFTKRLCGYSHFSHSERLSRLKLQSLEYRRLIADLLWCSKIVFNVVDISTRGNAYKLYKSQPLISIRNKSSAVAEMGDRGHNRHGHKRGGVLCPFRGALGTRLIQRGLCLLPYQVASSSIQPFGHNSVGCHLPHRNISTNYYLVVEMHTVTVCSDDAWYLLK